MDIDQDSAVTESDDPLCAGLECGERGACQVVAGEATCVCNRGFDGEQCDRCEAGLVSDDGGCIDPCAASDAPDCGRFGTCENHDGVATCACDHPYAGEACDECGEGFSAKSDGTCEADCGECGAHAQCNELLTTPSCECVAGYADTGSGCRWVGDGVTGGIVDGELDDPAAWTVTNMSISGGVATFDNVIVGGSCKLGAMEQLIRMPARAEAEPLVLEIEAHTTCTSSDPKVCPALLVDIGDSMTRVEVPGGAAPMERTLAVCLGEAAYTDEVPLRFRPALMTGTNTATCSAMWPSIEKVSIRPATSGECPADGELRGSLTGTSGWTLHGDATIAGNTLTLQNSADEARTLLSVPASGGIALRLDTTSPTSTEIRLGGLTLHQSVVTSPATICLPTWTFGSVQALSIEANAADIEVSELGIDQNDECTGTFDSSFERPFGMGSWTHVAPATRLVDGDPHSGDYAWRVQTGLVGIITLVQFPGYGDPGQRPTMSGWMRVEGTSMRGTIEVRVADLILPAFTTVATSWGAKRIACLGEEWAGQPGFVMIGAIAQSTGSGTSPTPTLWVDDLGPDLQPVSNCD